MKMLGKSSLSSKLKVLLDTVWYLGIVIAVLGIIGLPLSFWALSKLPADETNMRITIGDIGFRMEPEVATLRSAEGVTAYVSEGVGTISVNGSIDAAMMATAICMLAVFMSLGLFVVRQLRKIFRTFAEGAPFAESNVGRLRAIGFGMLGLALSSAVFDPIMTYFVSQQFESEGVEFVSSFDVNGSSLFSAAVVFVLAEIFRLGAQLEEEQALTV